MKLRLPVLLLALCGVALCGVALCGPAWAQVDEDLLARQDAVAAAAAAVAQARADGARRKEIAALMAAYREQAEALQAMAGSALVEDTIGQRRAALTALVAATAEAEAAPDARAVIDAWLGPLEGRLDLLDAALVAAGGLGNPALVHDMMLDVESQALAVSVAAAHDATIATVEEESARVRAAALGAAADPGSTVSFASQVDIAELLSRADAAGARAHDLWALRDRAVALLDTARRAMPVEP